MFLVIKCAIGNICPFRKQTNENTIRKTTKKILQTIVWMISNLSIPVFVVIFWNVKLRIINIKKQTFVLTNDCTEDTLNVNLQDVSYFKIRMFKT